MDIPQFSLFEEIMLILFSIFCLGVIIYKMTHPRKYQD